MGKSVLGRLRVFFSSSGSGILERERIPFLRLFSRSERRETSESGVTTYVTIMAGVVSAVTSVQPIPGPQNRTGRDTQWEIVRLNRGRNKCRKLIRSKRRMTG